MGRDVKQMSIGDGCISYRDEMGMIAKLGWEEFSIRVWIWVQGGRAGNL